MFKPNQPVLLEDGTEARYECHGPMDDQCTVLIEGEGRRLVKVAELKPIEGKENERVRSS